MDLKSKIIPKYGTGINKEISKAITKKKPSYQHECNEYGVCEGSLEESTQLFCKLVQAGFSIPPR